jgi:hypothetical protein
MQARDCCPERKTIVPDDIIGDVVACVDDTISLAFVRSVRPAPRTLY